ncbi:uncharacterized protein CLUP02_11783 [Colletotrichum lupini]|uniref:Uncharacterized protein n=1 Tax=Colletotrichum lupini TaxID=145971 RepID=A0A9Q8SZW1_9PEZI|nr:uncharacterized protein CLUP02_11783 [Colletotrichum lupini]UQC86283.1 hypothetical protein CLUP02_11783 [Colletotrichum lupini]
MRQGGNLGRQEDGTFWIFRRSSSHASCHSNLESTRLLYAIHAVEPHRWRRPAEEKKQTLQAYKETSPLNSTFNCLLWTWPMRRRQTSKQPSNDRSNARVINSTTLLHRTPLLLMLEDPPDSSSKLSTVFLVPSPPSEIITGTPPGPSLLEHCFQSRVTPVSDRPGFLRVVSFTMATISRRQLPPVFYECCIPGPSKS